MSDKVAIPNFREEHSAKIPALTLLTTLATNLFLLLNAWRCVADYHR
ncbi:hypothetical protein L360_04943 [Enterobacter sp. MGH 14]|nr:hypothetical protein L360_04943 [Enterobacter sp. MGH 14]